MRGTTLNEPPPLARRPDLNRVTQVREYRLLTPLFGGGVRPGEADPVTLVRGSTIRGQLRFWWRAARGGHSGGDLARLKAAEDILWGAASSSRGAGPSLVDIRVTAFGGARPFTAVDRSGRSVDRNGQPLNIGNPNSVYSYAAFPLNDKPGAVVLENVAFRLTVSFLEHWEGRAGAWFAGSPAAEVAAALWAWETFGGIGARTRRGFGALQCVRVDDAPAESFPDEADAGAIADWVVAGLRKHVVTGTWPQDVPHLSAAMPFRVTPAQRGSIEVWRGLLDRLKGFRQQRRLNRLIENGRTITRPGRNHWPEQDEVRRITRRRSSRHRNEISSVRKFPRAAFGLPLIIQYKRDDQRDGDPIDNNTVVGRLPDGTKLDRLASPLILRPLANKRGAFGLAAILQGVRMPNQLVLEHSRGTERVEWKLSPAEAASITTPEGTPLLNGETDVLQAFLKLLEK